MMQGWGWRRGVERDEEGRLSIAVYYMCNTDE